MVWFLLIPLQLYRYSSIPNFAPATDPVVLWHLILKSIGFLSCRFYYWIAQRVTGWEIERHAWRSSFFKPHAADFLPSWGSWIWQTSTWKATLSETLLCHQVPYDVSVCFSTTGSLKDCKSNTVLRESQELWKAVGGLAVEKKTSFNSGKRFLEPFSGTTV